MVNDLLKKLIPVFIFFLAVMFGCDNKSDDAKLKLIENEIGKIINRKEQVVIEMKKSPNILSPEFLENFPTNRAQLAPIAAEKKRLFEELAKLSAAEVEKLREAENLTLKNDFSEYLGLMRKHQEKSIEYSNLNIQSYNLILDNEVNTRRRLEENLTEINKKQDVLNKDIGKIEEEQKKNPNHYQ